MLFSSHFIGKFDFLQVSEQNNLDLMRKRECCLLKELMCLSRVVKRYPSGGDEILALAGVSLSVCAGEFAAVTGMSGSGKSTLMNLLGCLDLPDEGVYRLDGVDISSLSDRQLSAIRNRKIGFIFQGFNLIPSLNALENVELPLAYRGLPRRRRRLLAEQALALVGLEHRTGHKPGQMSGGQQQRVAIARAIAAQPEIILADEPTGNLDSVSGRQVLALLQELNRSGRTILLITHDESIAAQSRRVIRIRDGKILSDSAPPEGFSLPAPARPAAAR